MLCDKQCQILMDTYFWNFQLIYSWERIHRSYYSEMDFGIGGMDGLTLKHGTLKYVFTSGGWKISEIQTTNNLIYTLSKNSFCQFYKILIK